MKKLQLIACLAALSPQHMYAMTCEKLLSSVQPFTATADIKDLLSKSALQAPTSSKVFYDPPDTATFVSAIDVLTNSESTVLNLGTGSGTDSFQAATKAEFVLGIDICHTISLKNLSKRQSKVPSI
jgi:hypothetical protein